MKMRWIAGAALLVLMAGACGGDSDGPGVEVAGPSQNRQTAPPGLIDNPSPHADTSRINTGGYFGSGHNRPPPDTGTIDIP